MHQLQDLPSSTHTALGQHYDNRAAISFLTLVKGLTDSWAQPRLTTCAVLKSGASSMAYVSHHISPKNPLDNLSCVLSDGALGVEGIGGEGGSGNYKV